MPFHKLQKGGKIWTCLPCHVFRTWDSSSQLLSLCISEFSERTGKWKEIDMLEPVYGNSNVGSIIIIIIAAIYHRITTLIHYS